MFVITHHDDGKEKYQSHEVSMRDEIDYGLYSIDFDITGYGATKEEAYDEFRKKLHEKFDMLSAFVDAIDAGKPLLQMVEVDCLCKPIEEGDRNALDKKC